MKKYDIYNAKIRIFIERMYVFCDFSNKMIKPYLMSNV